ncbi:uncharacterized protein LOC107264885 [Cephus cinctus]|uniref:Uncharacterized protein LOC107264885 n=1 Tax=Cephus cinctus TaxID=211228 RepID=A0AAJ7BLQ9_CEPCN|nr:uncharacterized protein LOC107264885 [Cephus cinctus]
MCQDRSVQRKCVASKNISICYRPQFEVWNDRRTWHFHEVMDSIFAKKAWCSPVALASSSGLCVQPGSAEDVTSDSGIALTPSTRPLKANIAAMLEKRIRQKEEHEKARAKRHREKMEMDKKLLVVLEKLASNK